MNRKTVMLALSLGSLLMAVPLWAQEEAGQEAELAKELQNPIASLISMPLQNNWDFGIGPANAMKYTVNIQPVIPFSIGTDWNLITRIIVPVIYAESPVAGGDATSGLGDVLQSFFFSPKAPVGGGIVGGGPVILYPSATEKKLGADKWGAGPTAVVLKQQSGWTFGMLANHLWSFAEGGREEVSATFLQPFVSFTTKTYATIGLNTESSYDWKNRQWTVPINDSVSQLLKLGGMPVQFQAGGRAMPKGPAAAPIGGCALQ